MSSLRQAGMLIQVAAGLFSLRVVFFLHTAVKSAPSGALAVAFGMALIALGIGAFAWLIFRTGSAVARFAVDKDEASLTAAYEAGARLARSTFWVMVFALALDIASSFIGPQLLGG